ncbi:sugar transport protein 8-like [Spinacia oleracea]|uniref:Sugar transport protein 8-like n=1 Tax=Spinacia oleracea TaxID=3562 RepID=A0ABM3RA49_SPIOL|nr:sugar transport protein 8-like [Spinacia oleracea]
MFIGIILITWFPATSIACCGFVMQSIGIGLASKVIPTIAEEITPYTCPMLFNVALMFGPLGANVMNLIVSNQASWGWRVSYGIVGGVVMIILLLSLFVTESPAFMLEKNKIGEAETILQKVNGKDDIKESLSILKFWVEKAKKSSPKLLIKPLSHPPLIITLFISILPIFGAVDTIQFYGPLLFKSANILQKNLYFAPIGISLIQIFFRLLSLGVVELFGRKKLLLFAISLRMILEVVMCIEFYKHSHMLRYLDFPQPMLVVGGLYVAMDAFLTPPNGWLEVSFPPETKQIGSTISITLGPLQNAITAAISVLLVCKLNRSVFFFFFLGMSLSFYS